MQKIEFETIIKNGVINIPKSFKDFNNTKARVILNIESITDKDEKINKFKELRDFNNNHTQTLKFDDKTINVDELINTINEVNY